MLFSKLLFPLVALFGFATVAFATPIAEPAPVAELETRDAQAAGVSSVMSALQELQNNVAPIVSSLSKLHRPKNHILDIYQLFLIF